MDILNPIRHHLPMISTNLGLYSAQEQGRMLRHYLGICMHMYGCIHLFILSIWYYFLYLLYLHQFICWRRNMLLHTVPTFDKQHPIWPSVLQASLPPTYISAFQKRRWCCWSISPFVILRWDQIFGHSLGERRNVLTIQMAAARTSVRHFDTIHTIVSELRTEV